MSFMFMVLYHGSNCVVTTGSSDIQWCCFKYTIYIESTDFGRWLWISG